MDNRIMKINIQQAVNRLFPKHHFKMIYSEAIANALDAGATEIDIEIIYQNSTFSKFTIRDNGKGFTKENYKRFSNLMDSADALHKGQGRLVYLHYFNNIKVESHYQENDGFKKIEFSFNYDFSDNQHTIGSSQQSQSSTCLSFEKYNKEHISSFALINAESIKEHLLAEFLPSFIQMKEQGKSLFINIKTSYSKVNNHEFHDSFSKIDLADIPCFQKIKIEDEELSEVSKKLQDFVQTNLLNEGLSFYYHLNTTSDETNIVTSIVIDNRAIPLNIIDTSNRKHFENIKLICFLSSNCFAGMVDGSRQELTINKKDKLIFEQLIKQKIEKILADQLPSFVEERKELETTLKTTYPHLIGYIDTDDIGFAAKDDVLKHAQEKFFSEQKRILEKENLTDEDYQKALELSSRNLTEYILFRQIQLDKLKNTQKEDLEDAIHNTICPKKSFDKQPIHNLLFTHNAWILDERFMTFVCSSSDNTIQQISKRFQQIFNNGNLSKELGRPDYLLFFSSDNQTEFDLVCFEFKRLNISKNEKMMAEAQLVGYIGDLRDAFPGKIRKAWMFALVDIDDEFRTQLHRQEYKHRFTVQGELYSRYYSNVDAEINFIDFNALIHDADARNKTFMDILKKGFEESSKQLNDGD